ncbi:hypothetical protein L3476_10950 [Paenibacillus thiaminolyticus]|uniref:hypothetical protein n=1 Tax=Paenibacillus thiaminolyticus TaxID=49283 RepID=UPI0011629B4E|nr:hypothetical protein [Paenibacillus thiaminolyticus]MDG0871271.1 hypothetical protein [Paenibacillus thiaminolyticus]NGP62448.1 hypothetical protein [Paenibacillus thiaminolyticus]WCR29185.1 hypothetical protein L3476_10950 [Paenibacillus thiaminolyticus]
MKKFVSTLLVFALMLVFSTSAFAIPGMGDTMEKAIKIEPGIKFNGVIQDSTDYDWFTWENKTTKNRYLNFQIWTPSAQNNLQLGAVMVYPFGHQTLPFYAEKSKSGTFLDFRNILVPAYAGKVYLFVKSTGNNPEPYEIKYFTLTYEKPGDLD